MEEYANKELFSRSLLLDGPSLPEKLSFRPLQRNDWSQEFNTLLNSLSEETFELSKQDFEERFDLMQSASPQCYFIVVIENTITKEIIACGTVFIEYKFLKSASKAAHIEDVVVAKSYRGKNLGKLLIEMLSRIARSKKCYKIVLDCKEHNVEFYKKCNFNVTGVEMKQYI
ncbi:hypothetical protein MERGE_000958 [Pneumocystis wakefieldiae]|uniref:Glucosamine 6-phosphate N-acetyltransferase n=1 Tax=Pneumocystis wakefieldiae TaxID=38082 RepID=A0A899G133_9ASCO|nr:hypothetical protein MERGE_000958 [Pneumocystis wakefieldiae]